MPFQLKTKQNQILAEYVFHMRYCLLVWRENEEGLDILQIALPQPPLCSEEEEFQLE